ncbi:MAG TPA: hypothetical protein VHU88_00575 [Sporichthyaceae bacterium]|nr:hypothetical protein [Sporichthyaceae bacterium]
MRVGRPSTLLAAAVTAISLFGAPTAAAAAHKPKPDPTTACLKAAKADHVGKSYRTTACGEAAGGDDADCAWQIMRHSTSNTDSTARDVCNKAHKG